MVCDTAFVKRCTGETVVKIRLSEALFAARRVADCPNCVLDE